MTLTNNGLRVDPSNAEQARAWDGEEGAYWAAHAGHFDRSIAAYHLPFLDAAAIGTGEHVLDVGCGTGQTTCDAARRAPGGGALGVDLSAEMIAFARRLATAEGLGNARFEQADAQIHPFDAGSFDVAISRTGAMFFGGPDAAFANIARALRPVDGWCCWPGSRCRPTNGSPNSLRRSPPAGTCPRRRPRRPGRPPSPTPTGCASY